MGPKRILSNQTQTAQLGIIGGFGRCFSCFSALVALIVLIALIVSVALIVFVAVVAAAVVVVAVAVATLNISRFLTKTMIAKVPAVVAGTFLYKVKHMKQVTVHRIIVLVIISI